jgi:ubiquinone biosynthesis protein
MDAAVFVTWLVSALLMIALFGVVIRRLLGVRIGTARTLLAAFLALWITPYTLKAMIPHSSLNNPSGGEFGLYLGLSVGVATVSAMLVLVVAEILVPTGSVPGPLELFRSWRGRVARARRYSGILRIAVRHGLGRFLRGSAHSGLHTSTSRQGLAQNLREALDEGGVTFVKLGQLLSTRRDLLPAEFVSELTSLQDQATPVSWTDVSAALDGALGRPVDEVFTSIDEQPLAAASIGQVHVARLASGESVVVKVRRPGIEQVVERDLDIVGQLAATLEARTSWGHSIGLRALADGFARALREELDFTVERDNMRAVAASLGPADGIRVRVPTPVTDLCTAQVLVMDRLPGTPLGSAGPLLGRLGDDVRQRIAATLLDAVVGQMLTVGVFHADPHPGNILVDDDGALGLLDLGSVGRLDGTTREAFGRLLLAMDRMNSLAATDALLELVDRPDEIDERSLERALGQVLVRYASPGSTVGAAAFTALFRLVTETGLAVPSDIAAVFRSLATLEGTLTWIAPGFNVVDHARQIGRERFGTLLQPRAATQLLEDELASLLPTLRRLPRRVDRIGDALEHGRLKVNVSLFADRRDRALVIDLLHRVLLTVLGATAGIMAVVLLGIEGGPRVTPTLGLFAVFGYALLVCSIVLVLRVLGLIFRRE